ncbi:Alcohol dehydrogenase GroES-like domain-containing protein [Pleurostoma richardsiae]|uniref:Alcohol dehydrogenase GroES-like domain-containing protein n=1 Tax=Pleurostoma richardsiae TaxID=41990 RepID=A0AA38RB60_9PEZI|nr:Alcohol dehydrogenase GroES-like domain-containing protein [Pleurostoma richardsiae]
MTASTTPSKSHRAAVLFGAKELRLEQVPTPELQPHEVQVAPRATGICGTDLHYYQNGRNGVYVVETPLVLGHEAAGEVVAVGAAVTTLRVGDRVAVEPQLACLACGQCSSGRYNLCPRMRFNGSASARPPAQGSLQELWNHPARLCYRLPDSVGFDEGALVEPLSVALHSVRKGRLEAGQRVVITGAGAIGLLCARVAKISGASSVVMVDVDEARLTFARRQKLADQTFRAATSVAAGESAADFAARTAREMREALGVGEADLALECTGVESCVNICLAAAAPGSKVILVGMGRPLQQVNLGMALTREMELIGVWRYANTFQPAIDLIAAGMVDAKSLITHRFPMEKAAEALELALTKPADLIKCVLTSGG